MNFKRFVLQQLPLTANHHDHRDSIEFTMVTSSLMKKVKRDYHKYKLIIKQPVHLRHLDVHQSRKPKSKYGTIRGIEVGATFANRKACARAGVHAVSFKGIHGSQSGAYSVCLSRRYEDNQDDGELIIYTGTGGQEDTFHGYNNQVKDQTFKHEDNKSLKMSVNSRRPVRVVRRANPQSKWAPARAYRYDGLYFVEKAYYGRGVSGFRVCRFQFRRLPNQPPIPVNPAYLGRLKKNGV